MYKQYYIYHWPRPLGPSADPNYEALSLVVTVPLAIWLARYEIRDIWKWIGRICTPILAFGVFLSQSRGGLLALTLMAVLAWFNSRNKMKLLAGFVAAMLLMFAISPGQMLERIQQIQIAGQAETGAEVSTRQRVELAKAGINMMAAQPLFGVGLGQFKSEEFHYNPVLTDLTPDPKIAHDTYVQLGAEGGIPTLALYLAILILTLSTCRSAQKVPGVPEKFSVLALSFQIGLIGIVVAEFFLTAQYIKEVWVLISLAPNLYAISLHAATDEKRTASIPARAAVPRPIVVRRRRVAS
jgi:O-antigen ligase